MRLTRYQHRSPFYVFELNDAGEYGLQDVQELYDCWTNAQSLSMSFEQLPHVAKILGGLHPTIIWFGSDMKYHSSFDFQHQVNFLNGAYETYIYLQGNH